MTVGKENLVLIVDLSGHSSGSGTRKPLPGHDAVVKMEGQSSMLQPWDLPYWTITR